MNEKVVIYIRVSTKEQADQGTSLSDQEKVARSHSKSNGWDIEGLYSDDCSGKSFVHRPGFTRLLTDIKTKRIKPNILLVARMDRFSRDTHNTLDMWKELKQYGVELMTCEANYDLSIPENFLPFMLQVILPQVENERRGLNTKNGMRAKIREGRYMGKAPRGYKNVTTDEGKTIVPDEEASDVQYAFEEIAKGIDSPNDILRQMRKGGFKMSTSQWYKMLRNVVYIGKVSPKEDNNAPSEVITGVHEAIILEHLFYKVQDILNGKMKPIIRRGKHDIHLPLKSLVFCPDCGKPYTGSQAKKKYYYYHCQKRCNEFPAPIMHKEFMSLLESFQMPKEFLTLYSEILSGVFKQNHKSNKDKVKDIEKQISELELKIDMAKEKLLEGVLDNDDFKKSKEKYKNKINDLHGQIYEMRNTLSPTDEYLESGVTLLSDLPSYYSNADLETKKLIVSSIFPENLEFNGENYRTPKLNAFIAQTANYIKVYEEGGKEKASISESLSTEVAPTRIELVSKV